MARHPELTIEQFATNDTSWFIFYRGQCVGSIHDLNVDDRMIEALHNLLGEENATQND